MISSIQIIILVLLSLLDSILTYHWASACIKWKPELTFKQVESNGFIIACWKNFGLKAGSQISASILLVVQFLLSMIHLYIYYIILVILVFAIINHIRNFVVFRKKLQSKRLEDVKK